MELVCAECGCASDEEVRGWAAFIGDDRTGTSATCVAVFCPACAWMEFGHRPRERARVHLSLVSGPAVSQGV